jgi:hypothetical protein
MKTSEHLIKAKQLISTHDKWTQGTCARDGQGNEVVYSSDLARCFCSYGALLAVNSDRFVIEKSARILRCGFDTFGAIGPYNDSHTHAEVMEGFDRAIEIAKRYND